MHVVVALEAHQQAAVPVQPRDGAFHRPAVPSQTRAELEPGRAIRGAMSRRRSGWRLVREA